MRTLNRSLPTVGQPTQPEPHDHKIEVERWGTNKFHNIVGEAVRDQRKWFTHEPPLFVAEESFANGSYKHLLEQPVLFEFVNQVSRQQSI